MIVRGRFAPSPTGEMHAGNIFAALMTWLVAKSQGGEIVLRIEDLDPDRSKQKYIDKIQSDFDALGLHWDEGPYFQSDREEAYREAFKKLSDAQEVYPCFCSRAEINATLAPHAGEGASYSGACRNLADGERAAKTEELAAKGRKPSWRIAVDERDVSFADVFQGKVDGMLQPGVDDFVLLRSDGATAYQLAVVVDDQEQGVNSVVRGIDLLPATPKQVHLQKLLGFDTPQYGHVPLFVASDGRRLAKRNRSATLNELLSVFKTPEAVLGHIAHTANIIPEMEPVTPESLLPSFRIDATKAEFEGKRSIEFQPS